MRPETFRSADEQQAPAATTCNNGTACATAASLSQPLGHVVGGSISATGRRRIWRLAERNQRGARLGSGKGRNMAQALGWLRITRPFCRMPFTGYGEKIKSRAIVCPRSFTQPAPPLTKLRRTWLANRGGRWDCWAASGVPSRRPSSARRTQSHSRKREATARAPVELAGDPAGCVARAGFGLMGTATWENSRLRIAAIRSLLAVRPALALIGAGGRGALARGGGAAGRIPTRPKSTHRRREGAGRSNRMDGVPRRHVAPGGWRRLPAVEPEAEFTEDEVA